MPSDLFEPDFVRRAAFVEDGNDLFVARFSQAHPIFVTEFLEAAVAALLMYCKQVLIMYNIPVVYSINRRIYHVDYLIPIAYYLYTCANFCTVIYCQKIIKRIDLYAVRSGRNLDGHTVKGIPVRAEWGMIFDDHLSGSQVSY